VDSQQKPFVFFESKHGLVDPLTIEAPFNSPNTHGIHLTPKHLRRTFWLFADLGRPL
jgi:hypothetical protein